MSYPAYPPAQPMVRSYALGGLVTALTVLLSIMIVVEVIAAAGLFYRASLFDTASRGGYYTDGEATLADVTVMTTVFGYLLLFVAIAVVFIIWQWRHAKNAHVLGVRSGLGPGWAIGGWCIPVAGFILPAMQIYHSTRGSAVAAKSRHATLLVFWALTFALGNLLVVYAAGVATDGTSWSAEALRADALSDRLDGSASVAHIVAAALCIAIVRRLSAEQGDALDSVPTVGYPQAGYPQVGHPQGAFPQVGHPPASDAQVNPWESADLQPSPSPPPRQSPPPGPPRDPWQSPPR
jgi:hypothetical protein